ncbi:protein lethal(2)k10201 [Uranotaenia lowii]|uniref:protein lethal(2)k10201 n=1 Tax=Uranotaenia lowii TaxID=190385 RepID=UPI00247A2BD0|nr:protein lethal(2)k10201 [Uranotaenia lowii]
MSNSFTSSEAVLGLLEKFGVGVRAADDEFFQEGNFYLNKFVKLGVLSDIEKLSAEPEEETVITCNIPGCRYSCSNVQDYEGHYNLQHRYACGDCKKTLPNAHLLDLHLSETHDSYFAAQVQAARKPMYACFLEECPHKSQTPSERRDHCIKEHKFPHNFRFDKQSSSTGLTKGNTQSLNTKKGDKIVKQSSTSSGEMDVDSAAATAKISDQTTEVPKCMKNFSFGHSRIRSFKSTTGSTKPKKNCDILESNKMVVDLLESLPTD